jgi:hypothetical protein
VAVTPTLQKYLELERLMLYFDETGDVAAADGLRDLMDPIWYALTAEERQLLDERAIGRITSLEEIRIPAGRQVFGDAPAPAVRRPFPTGPVEGWRSAA